MPPNETFADLLRQAGIDRPAWEGVQHQRPPRPMPRQMRPPAQRANDPRLAQSERDRALRQFDRSNTANVDTYQRQAFDQRNQVAEAASMAAESTGLPAIRRAGSDLTRWGAYTAGTEQGNDDLASGALNLGAGSLGVLGMAGMVPRAPMRGALRPPVTAPEMMAPSRITRPPTEIAPNGMPIAPPRPFRNSLRGGSSDLMDAAGMMAPPRTARPPAQAPDAGGGSAGQAPDVGNAGPEIDALEGPFFHGTSVHGFEVPSPRNQSGGTPAIYLAENERFARQFADIEGEGTGRVLQFSLRRDDIARMDNPEHFERVAQALSQRLGWEIDVARQQLRQRVQDGRLDWAYRQGNQAVRDAGFPAVALNDAYGERSIAVYNKDSLLRPNAQRVRPQK